MTLLFCGESVRPGAKRTVAWLRRQDVRCRVVSGDDSRIVGAVARSVGLRGEGRGVRCVDARTLPKDADMVLADSDFSRLPQMMAPGRRVMAVMERVAGLFLVKTCYALLISAAVVLLGMPYPYLPRHLTYVGTLRSASPLSSCRCRPTTSRTPLACPAVRRPAGAAVGAGGLPGKRTLMTLLLFVLGVLVLCQVSRQLPDGAACSSPSSSSWGRPGSSSSSPPRGRSSNRPPLPSLAFVASLAVEAVVFLAAQWAASRILDAASRRRRKWP